MSTVGPSVGVGDVGFTHVTRVVPLYRLRDPISLPSRDTLRDLLPTFSSSGVPGRRRRRAGDSLRHNRVVYVSVEPSSQDMERTLTPFIVPTRSTTHDRRGYPGGVQ